MRVLAHVHPEGSASYRGAGNTGRFDANSLTSASDDSLDTAIRSRSLAIKLKVLRDVLFDSNGVTRYSLKRSSRERESERKRCDMIEKHRVDRDAPIRAQISTMTIMMNNDKFYFEILRVVGLETYFILLKISGDNKFARLPRDELTNGPPINPQSLEMTN